MFSGLSPYSESCFALHSFDRMAFNGINAAVSVSFLKQRKKSLELIVFALDFKDYSCHTCRIIGYPSAYSCFAGTFPTEITKAAALNSAADITSDSFHHGIPSFCLTVYYQYYIPCVKTFFRITK